MARTRRLVALLCCSIVAGIATAWDQPDSIARDKQRLAALQAYVGQWRGVGQPRRGSNQGAWTEESNWSWHFDSGRATLECELTGDKYFSRLRIQAASQPDQFELIATPVPAVNSQPIAPLRFIGEAKDDALLLTAELAQNDQPARIGLRLVAGGDRLLMLLERRDAGESYSRLAEVGSTRHGSSFAKSGLGGPECVVTGGLGTIGVTFQGQKYFVCCTGCRDLFNEQPERMLAEYRERKEAAATQK